MFLALVLLRNPRIFALTLGRYLQFVVSETASPRYFVANSELVDESIKAGLGLFDRSPFGRTTRIVRAYAEAHAFARFELYKSSREFVLRGSVGWNIWRRLFGPVSPSQDSLSQLMDLQDLAAVANKTTGYLSLQSLGIAPSQIATERRLVFPRYVRCLLGLVLDALHGGVRGNESRVLLAAVGIELS